LQETEQETEPETELETEKETEQVIKLENQRTVLAMARSAV
jgi:hypothetical protein